MIRKALLAAAAALAVAVAVFADPNPNSGTSNKYFTSWRPASWDTTISFTSASDDTYLVRTSGRPFPASMITAGFATDSVFVQVLCDTMPDGHRLCADELRGFGITTPTYYTWSWECEFCYTAVRVKGGGGGSGTVKVSATKEKGQR